MAERVLTVKIIGDAKSLEQAYARSIRSSQKFNQQVNSSGTIGALNKQAKAVKQITAAEDALVKVRSRRASSVGPFRLAGVGLGAATGLFAATQIVRELGDRLETTGKAAFTTEGRLRNMVSSLTSGNLIGAFDALRATPQTIEDLGFAAAVGRDRIQALQQVAAGTASSMNVLRAATHNTREETERLLEIQDKAGTSSQKLAQQYLAQRDAVALTELATNLLADAVARLGQQFLTQSGAVVTFKGAVDDLVRAGRGEAVFGNVPGARRQPRPTIPPLSPSQRRELDLIGKEALERVPLLQDRLRQLNNQIKRGNINQDQRLKIITNIKQTEAEVSAIYSDQAAARRAAGDAAAREAEAARERAKRAAEAARAAARERAERLVTARNARQFFALGLSPTGGERTPNIAGLRRQLGNFSDAVKGTFLDTTKTRGVLATVRKLLAGGFGKMSEDVRATVRDMLRDLNQQLRDQASTGNQTKFVKANLRNILRSQGLDPDEVKRVSFALSRVGAGGTVPGRGVGAFGRALPGGGGDTVVHTTIKLDNDVVGRAVTRHQQVTNRRNPPQKRGPQAGRRF